MQTEDVASGRRHDPLTADEGALRDYLLLDRSGGQRPIEVMHASIRNDAGDVSGAIFTFRDISERLAADAERDALLQREQRARVAADAASRMKDEFLTTLSHELRTPATSILGWVRVLKTARLEGAKTGNALDALERSAKTQAALIEDLLDVSRIVSGTLRLAFQRVSVPDLLAEASADLGPIADAKGVRLVLDLAEGTPPVQADPARLRQVFWNLLSNAIKFTAQGGFVRVALRRLDGHAEIAVSDSGAGIAPRFLPHVFEIFQQADRGPSRPRGGLGLGLALVRHLVELHGGTVRVDSPGEGKGTVFTVGLPLDDGRPRRT
jgi:signal transduction histidine kinase